MKVRAKRGQLVSAYSPCFICGVYGWAVSKCSEFGGVELCLPCYVDVLEVRQARGLMGRELSGSRETDVSRETESGPEPAPGKSPSPTWDPDLKWPEPLQLDLFH